MHPAKSVIFFTTASGAGYGLIVAFFVFDLLGIVPREAGVSFTTFLIAFALIVGGLLSSTFHLGHPERAWRAFSQWRTSWLSREGIVAVFTFAPAGLYVLLRIFSADGFRGVELLLGCIGALSCMATVYCTAMIYASLRPVSAWSNHWTPAAYIVLSLMTGLILFCAIAAIFGFSHGALTVSASVAIAAGLAVKLGYWSHADADGGRSTPGSATGLGSMGKVRLLEAPHSQANYLMKEMVFRIARKHAAKLRKGAIACGFVAPFISVGLSWLAGGGAAALIMLVCVAFTAVGVYVERWLFFAEARHTVGLYYGSGRA